MVTLQIVIVNFNLTDSVRDLLISIFKYVKNLDFKITVVDNNSSDRSITQLIEQFPLVEFLLLNTNYGFGHANNQVLQRKDASNYLLINPDTTLIENSISTLLDSITKNKDFGIIGPLLFMENGEMQYTARDFPSILEDIVLALGIYRIYNFVKSKIIINQKKSLIEVDYVSGACMLIKKEVIDEVGLFDTDYFLFSEETDLCYRVKKNSKFKIGFLKSTKIMHISGKITNVSKTQRVRWINTSKLLFYSKHYPPMKVFLLRLINGLGFLLKYFKTLFKSNNVIVKQSRTDFLFIAKNYLIGHPKDNINKV